MCKTAKIGSRIDKISSKMAKFGFIIDKSDFEMARFASDLVKFSS